MRQWDNFDQDSFVPACRLLGLPVRPDTYLMIEFGNILFQCSAMRENDGIQGAGSGAGRGTATGCRLIEVSLDCSLTHLFGMVLAMKEVELTNPFDI